MTFAVNFVVPEILDDPEQAVLDSVKNATIRKPSGHKYPSGILVHAQIHDPDALMPKEMGEYPFRPLTPLTVFQCYAPEVHGPGSTTLMYAEDAEEALDLWTDHELFGCGWPLILPDEVFISELGFPCEGDGKSGLMESGSRLAFKRNPATRKFELMV
ncbi:MAG: hypothetical protein JWM36_2460 [Hyphomicrobiales bacterium]|nr:hypothetical protein [Hyphomicrobiales bacterium]